MPRSWLAVLSLCSLLVLAVLTPSGTTLWTLAAGDYQIAVEGYAGSSVGRMTVTNSLNGRSAVGSLYPATRPAHPAGASGKNISSGSESASFPSSTRNP